MAEPVVGATPVLPRALAEPTVPVSKRWIASLGLGTLVL